MSRFYEIEPTSENYWRAIILFGRNSASYKFALAKSLFNLYQDNKTVITLEDLAIPYSQHLCEHLKKHPKQGTSENSSFLNALKSFNANKISEDEMVAKTVKNGFSNVLDAFHNVHGNEVGSRFFIDERNSNNGIRLSDDFIKLGEQLQFNNLEQEVESRWQLVEAAWENNIARNLMLIEYDKTNENFIGDNSLKRTTVTSARPALNGYQKGRCFYCFSEITVNKNDSLLADVDHFFPHVLKQCDNNKPVDGVSNLVLSCKQCNRGEGGKFEKLPSIELLDRLYTRNEYLISSHHPLRETLIAQTGITPTNRQNYIQDVYNCASTYVGAGKTKWQPEPQGDSIF